MSAVLKHIAAIAKGLSKAELHVLIELAARAGGHDVVASSRELAEETGLARSSVQLALDSLQKKGIILSDSGTASKPAMHRLLFLDAGEIQSGDPIFRPEEARESGQGGLKSGPVVAQFPGQGGPTARPVVARNPSPSGLKSEPGVAQLSGQGGLISGPLAYEKSNTCEPAHIENASAHAKSIEKNNFDTLIDRIQTSKRADFEDEIFEAARDLIASHHAKFAREGSQLPGKPDDQITAQFLAVADWPRLSRMLHDLLTERQQTSFSWGWYVTVALQRIHGVAPNSLREVRGRLRKGPPSDFRKLAPVTPRRPLAPDSCPATGIYQQKTGMGSFEEQVRILAASKSIR